MSSAGFASSCFSVARTGPPEAPGAARALLCRPQPFLLPLSGETRGLGSPVSWKYQGVAAQVGTEVGHRGPRGSQPVEILTLRDVGQHLKMLLVVRTGEGGALGFWWVEAGPRTRREEGGEGSGRSRGREKLPLVRPGVSERPPSHLHGIRSSSWPGLGGGSGRRDALAQGVSHPDVCSGGHWKSGPACTSHGGSGCQGHACPSGPSLSPCPGLLLTNHPSGPRPRAAEYMVDGGGSSWIRRS